jgi:lycopene beta-cyclase
MREGPIQFRQKKNVLRPSALKDLFDAWRYEPVMIDLVLVGGNLANALLAWRLAMRRPDISLVLLEERAAIAWDRRWTFLGSDLTSVQLEWAWVLVTKSWPSHDVFLKPEARRIGGGMHFIDGADLHWKVADRLGDRLRLKTRAVVVEPHGVTLASGERLEAKAVIDGRASVVAHQGPLGFHHAVSQWVSLGVPHRLEVPLLLDARGGTRDAFASFAVVPLTDRKVLLERHVHSTSDAADLDACREDLAGHVKRLELKVDHKGPEHVHSYPVPLGSARPRITSQVPVTASATGLFHAFTGHELPMAVDVAHALPERENLSQSALGAWFERHHQRQWARQARFRFLNRRLFRSKQGAELVGALYGKGEASVARFSAGTSSWIDLLSALW